MPTAIQHILQDARFALRIIRRNPGFSLVAILSLAIGIGSATSIFSLLNAVVLQPLPYPNADRLFAVREVRRTNNVGIIPVNPTHARAWAADCPSLEQVAILQSSRGQVAAGTEPATLPGARVTHNFFTLLGVTPMLGRAFREDEEQPGRDRVVILTETLWRSRFNADAAILGRTVSIDGIDHEVVGIVSGAIWNSLAGGMQNTPSNRRFELFRPLAFQPAELARQMGNYNYAALIRLKPGVTPAAALGEINVVQARLLAAAKDEGTLEASLIPLQKLVTGATLGLWLLGAAVGAVLLIVCVNLANLLLSRATARARETAVRAALGASRARQFQQALTESALLAACGGILGTLLAAAIVRVLASTSAIDLPRLHELRIDGNVLMFAVVATMVTGIVFGAAPAWRISRNDPNQALRAGSRTVTDSRGVRLREMLIGTEVGLSTALLIVAALLAISWQQLVRVDKGFDTQHVLTFDIDTAGPRYADNDQRSRFFDRVLARMAALPRVEAAGFTTHLPLEGNTWNDPIYRDKSSEHHPVDNRYASPEFFRAMGITILQGRAFDETDRNASVAVLSQKAAQLIWPDDPNPIGREFFGEDDKLKRLVGIVGDVRATLSVASPPHAYYPYWQRVPGDVTMVIRTTATPDLLAARIRAALHAEDPQLPIAAIESVDDIVNRVVAQPRFQSLLVAAFAIAALLVASLGIYGIVAYSVTRRRAELGIRLALGAKRANVLMLIVRQGMMPVVFGVAGGVAAALAMTRVIRGLLFGVGPTDPTVMIAVAATLIAVGAAACLVPAFRATTINTVDVLRAE